MNTPTKEPPITETPQGDESRPVLLVRIRPHSCSLWSKLVAPEDNFVGTLLLFQLLCARFELAGIRVISQHHAGLPLNSAYLAFELSTLKKGLETAQCVLREVFMSELAQIAWFDPREEIDRMVYPIHGIFERPTPEEMAKVKQAIDDRQHVISAMQQALKDAMKEKLEE